MDKLADGQHYEKQRFTRLMLPAARLASIEFSECVFDRCMFTEATFYRCVFRHCRVTGSEMSAVRLTNATLVDTHFSKTKIIGVDWTVAGANEVSRLLLSVGFEECLLDLSSFFGLSLKETKLLRCSAKEVDFGEADLSGADCRETDFAESKFLHTNLEGANFIGATNYTIDPTANRVRHARFSLPEAVALLRGFDVVIE